MRPNACVGSMEAEQVERVRKRHQSPQNWCHRGDSSRTLHSPVFGLWSIADASRGGIRADSLLPIGELRAGSAQGWSFEPLTGS